MEPEVDTEKSNVDETENNRGSIWHRWDPHIHTPGTVLEDRFPSEGSIDAYIDAINSCAPAIRALGITDYYVLDSYKQAQAWKAAGRLPNIELLFPNVELRFAVNAEKGRPINFHLIVSPEAEDHVDLTEKFLNELTFKAADGEKYHCTRADLIRLGKAHDSSATEEKHALRVGVEQFKIEPDTLLTAYAESKWARQNILLAISASSQDGMAQLKGGGLEALRKKLDKACRIVLSSKPSDREFWLGRGARSLQTLQSEYDGPKPCMHGSDAHDISRVGKPDGDRFCWIKGDLTFEALRQACLEPADRAFVGPTPPSGALPSRTVAAIRTTQSDWLDPVELPINPGLVAVIGPRGSGKTALVELIAAASQSIDKQQTEGSFLARAEPLMAWERSELCWASGEKTASSIRLSDIRSGDQPLTRYLSQQFVDRLCSSSGLALELVSEIERVIFESHPPDRRFGADKFSSLRDTRTERARFARKGFEDRLETIAQELANLRDLKDSVPGLIASRDQMMAAIKLQYADRKTLTPKNNEPLVKRLEAVRGAHEEKGRRIADEDRQLLELEALLQESSRFMETEVDTQLAALKARYGQVKFDDTEWSRFRLSYQGDVAELLAERIVKTKAAIKLARGPAKGEAEAPKKLQEASPFIQEDEVLENQTLSLLALEQLRLETLAGVDKDKRDKYNKLSRAIGRAEAALKLKKDEIKNAQAADQKISALTSERAQTYKSVFEQITKQEAVLKELYEPLAAQLKEEAGTLNKMTFTVSRIVNTKEWAERGESFLDLRTEGPFRGIGKLLEEAQSLLEPAWKTGDADAVATAMQAFREKHEASLRQHRKEEFKFPREKQREWVSEVANWLFDLRHVSISYGLQFEGVDIQQLSPGTRGIVLLLLYLSIDKADDRPLIIDQPEENLDPKSIFDELVGRFKEAKLRRQIIIVTHNANLVVNTDADQVIVAQRGEARPGKLPILQYISGGLENPEIRQAVCEILEGGEDAFKERAKRLRVSLQQT